jgi:ABC-2 type transport system permease protein
VTRVAAVARREYLERVRSKAFLVATVLGPLLMAALLIVPIVMAKRPGKPLHIAILDDTGELGRPVAEALAGHVRDGQPRFLVEAAGEGGASEREARLKDDVRANRLDGYLRLTAEALATGTAVYYGRNVSNAIDIGLLQVTVSDTLVSRRLAGAGLDPARVTALLHKVDLRTVRLTEGGEREDRGAAAVLSIVLMMILYTTLLMWGQAVATGVIEEKANRVVEVMVSSVSPDKLLAGKLLGIGAAGLTQLLVWAGSLSLASLGAARFAPHSSVMPEVTPVVVVSFVVFFLLGYALYSALFAAVGSAVNTTQEVQSLAFPIFVPLILAVTLFPMVLQSPDSPLSTALSLVPFLTPLLMFLRITVLTPPLWQIALSVVLTTVTVVLVLGMAARIYRVGILMYGKRPTLPEIVRWIDRA